MNRALDSMQPFAVALVKTQRNLIRRWQERGGGSKQVTP